MSKVISQGRFMMEALDAHNKYRKKHGCPPLELDPRLSELAHDWAQSLASLDRLEYKRDEPRSEPIGQNILRSNRYYMPGEKVTEEWYNENETYKYDGRFSPQTGHFTQIVWKSSKKVGFGFAITEDGKFYAVANYQPAGNYKNEYDANVPRPGSSSVLTQIVNTTKDVLGIDNRKAQPKTLDNSHTDGPSESYFMKSSPVASPPPSRQVPSASSPHGNRNLGSDSVTDRFIQEALNAHNTYRKKHNVDPVVHNPEISKIAQNYAQYIANLGSLKHSTNTYNGQKLGENLAFMFDSRLDYYPGDKAVEQWYSEIKDYRYRDYQPGTGHFTQVVWKGSREVGFGVAKSRDGSWYAVANYYPAGNLLGSFSENVFRPSY